MISSHSLHVCLNHLTSINLNHLANKKVLATRILHFWQNKDKIKLISTLFDHWCYTETEFPSSDTKSYPEMPSAIFSCFTSAEKRKKRRKKTSPLNIRSTSVQTDPESASTNQESNVSAFAPKPTTKSVVYQLSEEEESDVNPSATSPTDTLINNTENTGESMTKENSQATLEKNKNSIHRTNSSKVTVVDNQENNLAQHRLADKGQQLPEGITELTKSKSLEDADESLVDRLIHKIHQLTSSDESQPGKAETDEVKYSSNQKHLTRQSSTGHSVLSAANLTLTPTQIIVTDTDPHRPRSKTLDPSSAKKMQEKCTSGVVFQYAKSDEGFSTNSENFDKLSDHEKRLLEVRNKYIGGGNASYHNSNKHNQRRVSSAGEHKACSMSILLKPSSANQDSSGYERTTRSFGQLEQLKQTLMERGEKVGELDDRTEALKFTSKNLSHSSQLLAEKYKNKKWYEW